MAAPNLGQRAATVFERVVRRKPTDNVFTSQMMLKLLKDGDGFVEEPGGTVFEEPLEYGENTTFRAYAELETLDTTRVDVFDAARFEQKQVGGTVVFSEWEKAQAKGKEAKIDLVAKKTENGKNSLFAVMNRYFFGDGTAEGGNAPAGLAKLVSSTPTTGVVGGIDRSLFSFWRNRQVSGAKSSTAFDNLRGAMRANYNSCSRGAAAEHPQWNVSDQTSFEGYESTLEARERFTSKSEGDGGWKNEVLKFKGSKVTYDEDCPSATMYQLNPDFIKFRYLVWAKAFPGVDPANQFTEVVKNLTIGNMTISNARRLGVITSIS